MGKSLALLLLTVSICGAQGILGGVMDVQSGSTVPGPFNLTVMDNSACSNTTVPTNTLLGNSTFPSLPSGMSYSITNTHTDQTCSSTHVFTWPQATLSGGSWTYNGSSTSLLWTMNGNLGDSVYAIFPTSTVQQTISRCTPLYQDMPQNSTSGSRIDLQANQTTNALFLTGQFQPNGTNILVSTECGGTQTGVGATSCAGGEGSNGTFPTGQWEIMCAIYTVGSTPSGYLGLWNPPAGALCDGSSCGGNGTLIANSIVTSTPNSVSGATNLESELNGPANGGNGGISGDHVWAGTTIFSGMTSAQSTSTFPAGWGLQFPAASASPGSGNYGSAQTVTLSDISPGVSIYYTTCSTAGCTPSTPTTASTLYTSAITATPPEAVSAIAALTGWVNSSPAEFIYVSPNATYVGSSFATGSGSTTLAVTGLSIPSGDIIVCGNGNSTNGNTGCSDSHSDTFTCSSVIADSSGNGDVELCSAKAGAAVTSVTCSQTFSGHTINCAVAWYSPGTLAGTFDQSTGADNTSVATWNTGTTSTLGGSYDLVVGFWQSCCSVTSTPTDGSTQRVTCTGTYQCGVQDRTGWGTSGTYASGNWTSATGATVVIAIK